MHALFLEPKGRILFDALVFKRHSNPAKPELILDTHKSFSQVLNETLKKYSFRRAVSVSNIDENYSISSVFSSNFSEVDQESHLIKNSVVSFQDPRVKPLGWRRLDLKEETHQNDFRINDEEKFYQVWRIFNAVPEGPAIQNQIPHHFNFQYLNSISLNKGCYVGQELIARTATQGTVRTALFPFIVGQEMRFTEESVDWKFLKDLRTMKVLNENREEVGTVIESVANIGLVKAKIAAVEHYCFLESGEKINILRPSYLTKVED